MPRIYTKTGDDGSTGCCIGGRVPKDDLVTEAYGTTDEAVAILGLARSLTDDEVMAADLLTLQRELFVVGADLATNPKSRGKLKAGVSLVTGDMVKRLEQRIDDLVALRPLPEVFIVPGANPASAAIDVARSTIRRAERAVVALGARPTRGQPRGAALPQPPQRPVVRTRSLAGRRERTREPRLGRNRRHRAVVAAAEEQDREADGIGCDRIGEGDLEARLVALRDRRRRCDRSFVALPVARDDVHARADRVHRANRCSPPGSRRSRPSTASP